MSRRPSSRPKQTPRTLIREFADSNDTVELKGQNQSKKRVLSATEDPTPRRLILGIANSDTPSVPVRRLEPAKATPRTLIMDAIANATPIDRPLEPYVSDSAIKRARTSDVDVEDFPDAGDAEEDIDWDARALSPESEPDTPVGRPGKRERRVSKSEMRDDDIVQDVKQKYVPTDLVLPADETQAAKLPFVPPPHTVSMISGRQKRAIPRGRGRPPLPLAPNGEKQKSTTVRQRKQKTSDLPGGNVINSLFEMFSNMPVSDSGRIGVESAVKDFTKQISADLQAYVDHAGKITIDKHDLLCLFRRQRLISSSTTSNETIEDLMRRELPLEVLEELLPIARADNVVE